VVELIAKPALGQGVPLRIGRLALEAPDPGVLSWIAPAPGRQGQLAAALRAAFGFGWPEPGRVLGAGAARLAWFGPGQGMLIGPPPPGRLAGAALADQSDAWVLLRLDGCGVEDALARLVPLDLRPGRFGRGQVARSLLGRVPVVLLRGPGTAVDLLVPRSMGGSAVALLRRAMAIVAARARQAE